MNMFSHFLFFIKKGEGRNKLSNSFIIIRGVNEKLICVCPHLFVMELKEMSPKKCPTLHLGIFYGIYIYLFS